MGTSAPVRNARPWDSILKIHISYPREKDLDMLHLLTLLLGDILIRKIGMEDIISTRQRWVCNLEALGRDRPSMAVSMKIQE